MPYLVRGRYVLVRAELDGASTLLHDGAVVVDNGSVIVNGSYADLRASYPDAEVIGDGTQFVLPGLINAHQHGGGVSNTQLGHPDDHLETWLLGGRRAVDPYLLSLYTQLQQIRSGTTTVMLNYGGSPPAIEATLRAFDETGVRVAFSVGFTSRYFFVYGDDEEFLKSLPDDLAARARQEMFPPAPALEEYLEHALDLKRSYQTERSDRVRILLSPSGYQWATEDQLSRIADVARTEGLGVHTHIAETVYERLYAERTVGKTPVRRMHELGLTGPHVSFAHCVWITAEDIELLAETGTVVCHNPGSNLRLHAGIAPVRDMLARGVTVALGTDNGGLNDDDDILQEIGLSQRLHRPPGLQEQQVTPHQLMHMATLGGAAATTFGDSIGSLEPGRKADLVLLDWNSVTTPFVDVAVDPLETLVTRARAKHVDTVMIDGRIVLENGMFRDLDEEAVTTALSESLSAPTDGRLEQRRRLVADLEPHIAGFYRDWPLPSGPSFYRYNSR